jgi:hypothetical protein
LPAAADLWCGSFLDRWQTLIAGLLAMIGAGWTIWYIRKDIARDLDG